MCKGVHHNPQYPQSRISTINGMNIYAQVCTTIHRQECKQVPKEHCSTVQVNVANWEGNSFLDHLSRPLFFENVIVQLQLQEEKCATTYKQECHPVSHEECHPGSSWSHDSNFYCTTVHVSINFEKCKIEFSMIILCVKILLDRHVQSSCHSVIGGVYQRPKTPFLILETMISLQNMRNTVMMYQNRSAIQLMRMSVPLYRCVF